MLRQWKASWKLINCLLFSALIPVDWQLILIVVGLVVCVILIGTIIVLILHCRDRIKQPRPRLAQSQDNDIRKYLLINTLRTSSLINVLFCINYASLQMIDRK